MFCSRRARCVWCGNDLHAPEVVLCAVCRAAWSSALREQVNVFNRQDEAVRDEREAMALIVSPTGLADDWLERDHRRRVRVLTQHTGAQIGVDDMGRPLVYETVVVDDDDVWVRRYATEPEARAGHAIVLAIYGAGYSLGGNA